MGDDLGWWNSMATEEMDKSVVSGEVDECINYYGDGRTG
jgi:hypothetical protein